MKTKGKWTAIITGIIAVAVIGASNDFATDRYFPDQIAYSPQRTVRLEARSPDNEGVNPDKPFQRNFTYTLYDTDTNEVVWQRPQGSGVVTSPTDVFADDSRWAVIRTGREMLLAIDPTGKLTLKLDILNEALTDPERNDYTSWTSAGIAWGGLSFWYFARIGERPHFCIRSGWGRRILIDLAAGQVVAADDQGRSELEAREREFAMAILGEAATFPEFDEGERVRFSGVKTAVSMASQMKLEEAIPLLRGLESCRYIGCSGGRLVSGLKDGEINPWESGEYDVRMLVQLALRRFGQRPREFPATRFNRYAAERSGDVYEPNRLPAPRETSVDLVKDGMKPLEVLGILGPPDYEGEVDSDSWEYDMDASEPFTFMVTWGEDRRVSKTRQVRPVLWLQGNTRDRKFIDWHGGTSLASLDELRKDKEVRLERKRAAQQTGLIVLVGGAGVGLVAVLVLWCRRRRSGHQASGVIQIRP